MGKGQFDNLTEEDRERFEKLFLPYLDAAYNLARWIVQNEQDARDIVQDSYVRAFKGFRHYKDVNSRAWLLTIVRNTAYNWMTRHTPDEKIIPYDEEKHADIITINQLEEGIDSEGREKFLQEALERLPLEFREVIILYEVEGLSYKELATALGIPIGTVMSRLNRARRRLQEGSKYGT
jgi:RNA polymerase sigma-70 factor, ECF subfamily